MDLIIRVKDGQPFEHPIFLDNFVQAFPDVDVNNLPPEFAKFTRYPAPQLGPYEVYVIGSSMSITNQTPTTYPQAMLRWSNDGGSTWSNEHWVTIGQAGKYKNRAIWRRLGWSRDRIFEVSVTDPVKTVIVSANLKASVGDN